MILQLHGRRCEAWADHGKTDEDSQFIGGYWLEPPPGATAPDWCDEEPMTEEELDALTATHPDVLYDLWLESQTDRAELAADLANDDAAEA